MIRTSIAFFATFLLVACSSRDNNGHFMATDAGPISDMSIDVTVRDGAVLDSSVMCEDALDVVFVLDVSTSMSDVLGEIRAGIADMWNTATSLSANAQFSMVVFVDDAVAVNDCMPITSVSELQAQFDHWRDFCASNESPASGENNYDCEENSLDAIELAINSCPWRSPSTRILVHVTDDTFVERPDELSGSISVESTYAQVASDLVYHQIRFATFANAGTATCGDYSGAPGFHTAYMSQPSLPMQTGGRAWDLDQVRNGTLNMGNAISELLMEEYCTVFLL